jgi:MerR family transcriptional regulator, heat shock protein HspR
VVKPLVTIRQAATRLGISTRTIRIYETEGFITLARHQGRCLLTPRQIEDILTIERLKRDLGVNLAGIGVILNMRERMLELQSKLDRLEAELEERQGGA